MNKIRMEWAENHKIKYIEGQKVPHFYNWNVFWSDSSTALSKPYNKPYSILLKLLSEINFNITECFHSFVNYVQIYCIMALTLTDVSMKFFFPTDLLIKVKLQI